jgi:hypothetical protein
MDNSPKAKKKFYKRWWFWLGVFILLIIGAANSGNKNNSSNGSGNQQAASQNAIYELNQEVTSSDATWKVTNARDRGNKLAASESRYGSIAKAKTTTGKFIEVTFTVENKSKDLASITNPGLVDGQGREFTTATDVSEWVPEGKDLFLFTNLQPNLPKEFVAIYEVPADASGFKLKVGVLRPQFINLGI